MFQSMHAGFVKCLKEIECWIERTFPWRKQWYQNLFIVCKVEKELHLMKTIYENRYMWIKPSKTLRSHTLNKSDIIVKRTSAYSQGQGSSKILFSCLSISHCLDGWNTVLCVTCNHLPSLPFFENRLLRCLQLLVLVLLLLGDRVHSDKTQIRCWESSCWPVHLGVEQYLKQRDGITSEWLGLT